MLKKTKIILYIFIILNIGIVFGFIVPYCLKIKNLSENLLKTKYTLEELKNQNNYKSANNLNNDDLVTIENIFIKQDSLIDFITELEEIAEKYDFKQNIELKEDIIDQDSSKLIHEIPILINLEGRLENLLSYLLKIENTDYYININSLEVTAGITSDLRQYSPEELSLMTDLSTPIKVTLNGLFYLRTDD